PRQLEQIHLGMTRAQILHGLPPGKATLKHESAHGLLVTFNSEPAREARYVVRQLNVRFAADGHAVEVRCRYFDGPSVASSTTWMNDLLASRKKQCGGPVERPAPWARTWDQPTRKPAATTFAVEDDATELTFQRDAVAVEMCLRDRPLDETAAPPALDYLPRGVTGCQIGLTRDEVVQKWGVSKPVLTPDGALVLAPLPPSPYDVLLVWFDKDRVVRIVGRYAQPSGSGAGPSRMGPALVELWGREIRTHGWP